MVAMQDAVILANLVHELQSATSENLVEMFKDYQAERYPSVKAQMSLNQKVGKIMTGQVRNPKWKKSGQPQRRLSGLPHVG